MNDITNNFGKLLDVGEEIRQMIDASEGKLKTEGLGMWMDAKNPVRDIEFTDGKKHFVLSIREVA